MSKKNKSNDEAESMTASEGTYVPADAPSGDAPVEGKKLTDKEKLALRDRHFEEIANGLTDLDKRRAKLEAKIMSKRYPMPDEMRTEAGKFMLDLASGFNERITKKETEVAGFKFGASKADVPKADA